MLHDKPTPAALEKVEDFVGKRVMIRAKKHDGSALLLHGLRATVTAVHPLAANWCLIQLDPNDKTEYSDWSIAVDRLVLIADNGPMPAMEPGLEPVRPGAVKRNEIWPC